jgi:glutaredoxin-related protein
MTTIAPRSPAEIRRDIAKFEDWKTVLTVKASGSLAAWVEQRLAAAKKELNDYVKGATR